jgi:thiamine-monophosphate kinase
MGEFERISRFLRHFEKARALVGPGDDCAVVRPRANRDLCLTTDALVEGVHFFRPAFSFEDIGHKALAANLSDLAAMGARPSFCLCALQLPASVTAVQLDGLARGMARLARAAGLPLVGGNFSRAAELSVTLTLGGEVRRAGALTRAGGRPGDLLFVSGTLGDARLGLEQLLADPTAEGAAVRRQKRPAPRLGLGLLARRFATAAIDLSDGLSQDLGHLCTASGVGAVVTLGRLPLSRAVKQAKGSAAALFAAEGGEDYELLLAVPPRRASAFVQACGADGQKVAGIGELASGRAIVFEGPDGRPVERPGGFDHFGPSGRRIDRPSGGR